jgi:hypothetical protein
MVEFHGKLETEAASRSLHRMVRCDGEFAVVGYHRFVICSVCLLTIS